ncbi:hypothetical protein [Marinicella meishanensis]|nr:hypothetical protein [Marinicella sp. NBU2979]
MAQSYRIDLKRTNSGTDRSELLVAVGDGATGVVRHLIDQAAG